MCGCLRRAGFPVHSVTVTLTVSHRVSPITRRALCINRTHDRTSSGIRTTDTPFTAFLNCPWPHLNNEPVG